MDKIGLFIIATLGCFVLILFKVFLKWMFTDVLFGRGEETLSTRFSKFSMLLYFVIALVIVSYFIYLR